MSILRQAKADSLVRNSAYLMSATVVTSLLGYVFWIVAARLYPVAAIGEAGAAVSAIAFASLLGAMGGSSAMIAELPSKKDPRDWSVTVTTALVFTSATSAITAVATVVILGRLGHSAFLYREKWWIVAFVIGVVATTASQLLENIWVAQRQAGWFLGASSFFAFIKLIVIAVPALAVLGATGIVSAWSAALATTVGGCLLLLGRNYDYRPRLVEFRRELWSMRTTLTGNYLITVGDQVTLYLIPVLAAIRVSPSAAGWFYASWKIGGFYAVFASAVGSSTFAEGSHRPDRAVPVAIAGLKMTLPFIALGAAFTIFAGRTVLSVFGPAYATHAYTLLVLLSLSAFPDAVVNIYRSVLRAQRRYGTALEICWAISVTRVVLTWLALARFGIVGAGWAWLVTQTGGAIWCGLDLAWRSHTVTLGDAQPH